MILQMSLKVKINFNGLPKKFSYNKFWREYFFYLKLNIYFKGLGFIRKLSKSKLIWTYNDLFNIETNEQISDKLERELISLKEEENLLQNWNKDLKTDLNNLMEDYSFKEYGYFTYNDIKNLTKDEDVNVIAVRAPKGTILDMPDPQNVEKLYEESIKVNF